MNGATRRLVLVDIENLLGRAPAQATPAMFEAAFGYLADDLDIDDRDLAVIGVSPKSVWEAHRVAPQARIVTRGGEDGAELRLIEELLDVRFVKRRFSEVVIVSGDHLFVDSVQYLNYSGLVTTVAAIPSQLAKSLRMVAQRVVWLRRPTATLEAA